jgi:hypothetical protein
MGLRSYSLCIAAVSVNRFGDFDMVAAWDVAAAIQEIALWRKIR